MAYYQPEDLPIDFSATDPLEGDNLLYGEDHTDQLRDSDNYEQPSDRSDHWSMKGENKKKKTEASNENYHGRPFEDNASWIDESSLNVPVRSLTKTTVKKAISTLNDVRKSLYLNKSGFISQSYIDRMGVTDSILATLMDEGTLSPIENEGFFGYAISKINLAGLETKDFEEIKLGNEVMNHVNGKPGVVLAIDESNKRVELQYKDSSTGWANPNDLAAEFGVDKFG